MYKAIVTIIFLLFLFLPLQAFAQESTSSPQTRQQRLKTIRDQKKKAVVLRIDQKMSAMNKKHTERMLGVLEKLPGILNKISQKASSPAFEKAVAQAQKAISDAKTKVSEQAAKEYIIEVADEEKLRQTVGSVMSQMRRDLRDAHKAVVDTKQKVSDASRELTKLRGELKGE